MLPVYLLVLTPRTQSFLDHAKTQQLELSDAHIKIAELEKGLIAAQHQTVQIQRLDSSKVRTIWFLHF